MNLIGHMFCRQASRIAEKKIDDDGKDSRMVFSTEGWDYLLYQRRVGIQGVDIVYRIC